MRYHIYLFMAFMALTACSESKEKSYPTRMSLTESVYASATVQPDSLYQAYSNVLGILDKVWVEEGDIVKRGDPILHVTNTSPALNAENARLAWELAKENYDGRAAVLASIQDEIKAAKLKLDNDSINYFRQKNLWNQNIGSKVEFDSKQLAYQLSQNNLNLLNRKYEQTQNELETQLKRSENTYRTSLTASADFTIASKINGTVYALYKNPGEIVNTQEPVASVGKSQEFIIELLVDEVDIVKLKLGQKVYLTLDSYGTEVFEATLDKIYPRKDERSQTFKAEALFNAPPSVLYPGLSGEGNIVISQKEDALIIPKEFLIGDSTVITDEGETTVILGLQNLDMVEVIDGIDEKTAIYKPMP
ncbi:efflux RND transporter periplasmic adaptor subunit [Flagellimonas okinawensis]|uniref:Efflux RND transporter periplasmic adaptor subunit n=1 Tax=Flagellimonas okinawensis TaxID=3031324 RepID=A0ABT5XSN0_9FLAO|nr:efflux RND transporter periplasmic adaptor subunit [[Muricauda] okinawensis]MDF0708830.1 efflux RND transporter periplasmic adaptor subunit [[Muricauda] okinawensis]